MLLILVVHVAVAINIGLHGHLLRNKGCFKLSVFAYFAFSYLKLLLPGASERFFEIVRSTSVSATERMSPIVCMTWVGVGNREF